MRILTTKFTFSKGMINKIWQMYKFDLEFYIFFLSFEAFIFTNSMFKLINLQIQLK